MNFGKYTLLDRISHGGMAEVFRAKTFGAAGFERIVAIKLLLPDVARDQDFVTMLIDEAKIAGQLSHANIAQIFDLGMAEGRYYIVQEYVNGLDLRKILRRLAKSGRRLSVAQAIHIVLKACEGLEYAHNRRDAAGKPLNLVHRDVSPQNILISSEGEVKLIDFGIAKAEGRSTRTLAGLIKGKFAYMSPEQIRGLPVDCRSDVFATGIVLHELLTNKPLFKRKSEFETLKRARSGVIDSPSKLNPDVSPGLDEIALRALARHVEDRYASALELRDALWQFSRSSGDFYSRNELAAWMADEIAEEKVTGTGKADSGEFPLIEISDPNADSNSNSHPTVVDLSGQDRDSAELSGEVRQTEAHERQLSQSDALDQPSVEISSEALSRPGAEPSPHAVVDLNEEKPTLLYEPGSPEHDALSVQMTAEMTAEMTAPRAPSNDPTLRPGDVAAVAPAGARRTILSASAPQPLPGPRNPAAPSSLDAMGSGPPMGTGPNPPIGYGAPVAYPPHGSMPLAANPSHQHPLRLQGEMMTRPPPYPVAQGTVEEQPRSGPSVLLVAFALLVLIGAVAATITLVATS